MNINTLYNGDCLDVMKQIPDNTFDSVVTDPPYGIKFMSKKWDYELPSVEIFQEMLRVLKPGGHMLCACGTRTQHRMVCNIENAGLKYFNPHSFRDTLSRFGQKVCTDREKEKAWSQNFGHENPSTTFGSYGHIPEYRQGEILKNMAIEKNMSNKKVESEDMTKAIYNLLKEKGSI